VDISGEVASTTIAPAVDSLAAFCKVASITTALQWIHLLRFAKLPQRHCWDSADITIFFSEYSQNSNCITPVFGFFCTSTNLTYMAFAIISLVFPRISFKGTDATEITENGVCFAEQFQNTDNAETWWLWLTLLLMLLLWTGCAAAAYVAWRKLSRDLAYCWNQVGDEDDYIAQQAHRIDMLGTRCAELDDRIAETSNELSMTHDYVAGVHFAVVEGGGFLQHGLGLTNDQWAHLNTLERANMQAFHSMGSGTYMQLVRQKTRAIGPAEATD
jgi:hypothetical protein